jgi:hypothetical protein
MLGHNLELGRSLGISVGIAVAKDWMAFFRFPTGQEFSLLRGVQCTVLFNLEFGMKAPYFS